METKFHRTKFGDQQLFFRPFDLYRMTKQPTKNSREIRQNTMLGLGWMVGSQIFFLFLSTFGEMIHFD